MEESIRKHCAFEALRSADEATHLYSERLNNEITRALVEPYCVPCTRVSSEDTLDWVPMMNIAMEKGFDFFHHSKSELLNFAVMNRGDADAHINTMSGLCLIEYPGIVDNQPIYMVGDNGRHRCLVYACIGLPYTKAHVQKSPSVKWKFYLKKHKRSALKMIYWFSYLGLIDRFVRENNTIIFEGRYNLAVWLLPNGNLSSLEMMLKDVQNRAEAINSRFGLDTKLLGLFQSPIRRRCSLEYAFLLHKLQMKNH